MDDLISRQEVLTFIEKSVSEYGDRYSADMLNMWGLFTKVVKAMPSFDGIAVVRCCKCIHWNRDTIQYQSNDFRAWNEAECEVLASRDGYNEINRYVEAEDYCSYGERKTDG